MAGKNGGARLGAGRPKGSTTRPQLRYYWTPNRIAGFFENAPLEAQETEFAIDVEAGIVEIGRGVVRFLAIGWAGEWLVVLLMAQVLHAATFGSFHAAAVAAVQRTFPAHAQALGQTLFSSVGYGAAFGGVAPLLTMLNACATGVSVVNIDNGFGAGRTAALINRVRPT